MSKWATYFGNCQACTAHCLITSLALHPPNTYLQVDCEQTAANQELAASCSIRAFPCRRAPQFALHYGLLSTFHSM